MLDERELEEYIESRFTGRLFRQEVLETYDVPSDGDDLARYVSGEPGPDMTRKGPWMQQIRDEVGRGLHTYRVHVVRSPLSDYLRFEFEWGYTYNEMAGEHIRILDLAETRAPAELLPEDFWLIGDDHAVQMHYDTGGRFTGATIVDAADLPRYRRARDQVWNVAVPFARYWQAHPGYWRDARAA